MDNSVVIIEELGDTLLQSMEAGDPDETLKYDEASLFFSKLKPEDLQGYGYISDHGKLDIIDAGAIVQAESVAVNIQVRCSPIEDMYVHDNINKNDTWTILGYLLQAVLY